jgi:hypothetical protein
VTVKNSSFQCLIFSFSPFYSLPEYPTLGKIFPAAFGAGRQAGAKTGVAKKVAFGVGWLGNSNFLEVDLEEDVSH